MSRAITVILAAAMLLMLIPSAVTAKEKELINPDTVRKAALASGLDSLRNIEIPGVDLSAYLNSGQTVEDLLVVLGKALFWDMQVGSDGQACASCHFQAGADPRSQNQLNPGLRAVPPDSLFGNNLLDVDGFTQFGPGYQLEEDDFPLHQLDDAEEENFDLKVVTKDTNDVVSSQGVHNEAFVAVVPGALLDEGEANPDSPNAIFEPFRNVEPRNTPTTINALWNHSNFWDGRAHNLFNGSSVIGPLDDAAGVWVVINGELEFVTVRIENSSLASQAVGPPTSKEEMSFDGRAFPDIGHKLLATQPLKFQEVSATDSVLGAYAVTGGKGLTVDTYAELIEDVFQSQYWDSEALIDGYSQMEANFALFFGLAVQAYEFSLISDDSPFDRFMEGDNDALSQDQLHGLLVFLNTGDKGNNNKVKVALKQAEKALGFEIGAGNCISCHGGALFSDATFPALADGDELELIEIEDTTQLIEGLLALDDFQGLLDNGFANIGVRPTADDLGRGGMENGIDLSFVRQLLADPNFEVPEDVELPDDLPAEFSVLVDGAFKIAGLRNIALTAPYFHNGGQATLEQVVEFYDRQSDFGDVNIELLDRNMVFIDMEDEDEGPLIAFLLALTDERVEDEGGVFDHPQLLVPIDGLTKFAIVDGSIGVVAGEAMEIPAVGAEGRESASIDEIVPFLGIDQEEDD